MFKRIIIISILFALGIQSFAQLSSLNSPEPFKINNEIQNNKKRLRNFKVSLTAGYFDLNPYSFATGGLSFELFMGKHMSLNYNFNLGITTNSSNHFYYHGPAGASVGSIFLTAALLNSAIDNTLDDALSAAFGREFNLSSKLTKGLGITGFILILIPEGINYNIDIGKHFSISPYVNPLGLDFCASDKPFGQNIGLSWEYGSKLNFYFKNKRFLSPKVGIKNFYGTGESGLNLGLMYGYYF